MITTTYSSPKEPLWYKIGKRLPKSFEKAYHGYIYIRDYSRSISFRAKGAPDRKPLPPAMLMFKVAGTPNAKWFWQGGLLAKKSLIDILEQNGLDIKSFESILDFGCGCGRVIRHLDFLDKTNLFGTDYNIDLIRWCTLNLGFAFFTTNQLQPPLNYQDCKFDFVYAFSVFTHLPEELQVAWRDEIWRCLKPEGFFLMTTHGEHFLSELTTSQLKQFQAGDLVVKWSVAAGKNYCGAFHPFSYVKKKFGECFTIIDFKPKGAEGNPYQDVYLLKKN